MQEKIYLRPLFLSDINEKYLFWVNDPSVTEYLEIGSQRLTSNDLIRYVEESPKKGRYNYAIVTQNSRQHIGNGSLYSIEPKNKNFEIGWFIGEKNFWGGQYSSMIIFYLLKIGFVEMGLEKCIGGVEKENIKARMTNKFSGFKETKSHFLMKNNKKTSFIDLEITKKDWITRAKILNSQYPELFDEI
jgi:RimJ/RimL family protein N-acetyltransferase